MRHRITYWLVLGQMMLFLSVSPAQELDPQNVVEYSAAFVGLREGPGNRGPLIDYLNLFAGVPEGSPYCASFAHYVYTVQGKANAPGAWSPDWYAKWRKVGSDRVKYGDVGLVWFPSKGRFAHVICAVEKVIVTLGKPAQCVTIEANTAPLGNSRDGDGIYRRLRDVGTVTWVRWYTDKL